MKILMLHNFYQQPGGEDESSPQKRKYLNGMATKSSATRGTTRLSRISTLFRLACARYWNPNSHRELQSLIGIHTAPILFTRRMYSL